MWTKWDGSRSFKGDRIIRVRFRNGIVSEQALPARKWRGKWGGSFPENWEWDIIAVKPE